MSLVEHFCDQMSYLHAHPKFLFGLTLRGFGQCLTGFNAPTWQ